MKENRVVIILAVLMFLAVTATSINSCVEHAKSQYQRCLNAGHTATYCQKG